MFEAILFIILGFVLLMGGAEYAVRGAVAIANRLHIPSLIIGLTIVALGTSVPEFVVSIKSALTGNAGIAVGNVIGSNIANILLVLGASAVIYPVACNLKVFLRDFTFLAIVTAVFAAFALQGRFVIWNGWVLLGFLVGFVLYNYRGAVKNETPEDEIPSQLVGRRWTVILAALAGGLAAIAYGADFLVGGAVELARIFQVSEEIIGVTIIAIGTSMPEMATSCVAAFRHQNGIALGNVIGSNIWNIVFVMGATAAITDVDVAEQFIRFDLWIMVFASFLPLPVMVLCNKIPRPVGVFMLFCFAAYLYTLLLITRGVLILN